MKRQQKQYEVDPPEGEAVYLIHFDSPLSHARHYLGWASNVKQRIARHRHNNGAKLLKVLNEKGITWRLVRIWENGNRDLERKLKKRHGSAGLCPVCKGEKD